MALIDCPECSKKISDQTHACPQCGFPIKAQQLSPVSPLPSEQQPDTPKQKSSGYLTLILIIGIPLLGYLLIGIYSDYKREAETTYSQPTKPRNMYLETKASTMINAYKDNEVRADATYKDNILKVNGIVQSISSDMSDKAVVHLAPKGEQYIFNTVDARGDDNFHDQAINLQKGEMITIICTGDGEIVSSPQLKDCRFE